MAEGLNVKQFRTYIVRPALKYIGLHSQTAENLLIGTALTESKLMYLHQVGGGPAQGVFQMEPATEKDIWNNYLRYQTELADKMVDLQNMIEGIPDLIGNLYYQAAMCRVHYRRVPAALPDADDARGMAEYWKKYYNTHLGAGTVEKALPAFKKAI